ncbi:hypothetical protein DVH24_042090 [Malus domestica]|uniref:Aminotransferase class I/classII large domain-containing protein n=1 Tax=Malus domestica TaxID=3750 RepID=A0A498ITT1_MALDO|nr:hypothetical protein DVH24_042090 [Malus domestica]
MDRSSFSTKSEISSAKSSTGGVLAICRFRNRCTMDLHNELEECVANFVGKPAAIVFGMGYVTNSVILPILMGKGDLIVSDSLNHNSIVNGARGSGTRVCVFQHNSKFISYYIVDYQKELIKYSASKIDLDHLDI